MREGASWQQRFNQGEAEDTSKISVERLQRVMGGMEWMECNVLGGGGRDRMDGWMDVSILLSQSVGLLKPPPTSLVMYCFTHLQQKNAWMLRREMTWVV